MPRPPRKSTQSPAPRTPPGTPSWPDLALPGPCPNAPPRRRLLRVRNWGHHPAVVRSLLFSDEAAAVPEDAPMPDAKPEQGPGAPAEALL
jgi:hypothetical protein